MTTTTENNRGPIRGVERINSGDSSVQSWGALLMGLPGFDQDKTSLFAGDELFPGKATNQESVKNVIPLIESLAQGSA